MLPWHHLNSPIEQWAHLPSFLVGELMFITCAVLALVHAYRSGRDHVLIWIGALIAGTANDAIFMALPLVDTFWQAQATIMLTARMPLYIPCVYVCFMYFPTVAVRRLRLRPLAQAALTGIVACLFYAPYDIVGAKFLWWTWHDTDATIATRILGAPISSSLWVLTFVAAFSWLLDRALARDPAVRARTFALGLALVAALTTLLMMLQITILQQLDGGTPGYLAFAVGIAAYVALVAWGWRSADPEPERPRDRLLYGAAIFYFVTLIAIMAAFDPATHQSTGVHQTAGECYVEVTDITGATRHEYLCARDFDEDYSFECAGELPADGARWYTICGRAHTSFASWMLGVSLLGAVGIGLFTMLLGPGRRRLARRS
ncbi:MAG: hypothetical protein M5U28_41740 [Sandaracinaceae bacterium]|nr:hypothetical protein [Sandaracinaceae bacterium]